MTRALSLVTAPASEPVSLSEVKAWARIDGSDEDALLTSLIGAARESVEQYLRRSLITQTWKLTLDMIQSGWANDLPAGTYDMAITELYGDLPTEVTLPKGPVQSVTSVTTYDTTNTSSVYSSDNYFVNGDRLVLNNAATWPSPLRPQASCEILYVAGYGTASSVPQAIRQAIMIASTALYESRGMCDAMDLPAPAQRLLNPYRILGERG